MAYKVQLQLVKILTESKTIELKSVEAKKYIYPELCDEPQPSIVINLDNIFKLPHTCNNCDIKLTNDNTKVLLVPVAQCFEEPDTETTITHMLCLTKITCNACEASFLVISEQTIGEQLNEKFNDIEWESCFTCAMNEYINTDRYMTEEDPWKEYLYELTYVKETTHYDVKTFLHDDSEWNLMAEHDD